MQSFGLEEEPSFPNFLFILLILFFEVLMSGLEMVSRFFVLRVYQHIRST